MLRGFVLGRNAFRHIEVGPRDGNRMGTNLGHEQPYMPCPFRWRERMNRLIRLVMAGTCQCRGPA